MPSTFKKPRYQQIADELKNRICVGEYARGARLPSFPEMRRQGVSQNTMEKVYSLLEADGLIERTLGSGVYVAQAQKRKTKTGVIGVVGMEAGNRHPYWNHLLAGAQAAAQAANYNLLLVEEAGACWEKMDGLLAMGYGGSGTVRRRPKPMPAVSLLAIMESVPVIEVDEKAGMAKIVEHLIGMGHRKIAYLASSVDNDPRARAYQAALTKAGIEADVRWLRASYPDGKFEPRLGFAGHAFQTMQAWLRDDWSKLGCTAIAAHNDETAIGVLKALREAKIKVPAQVSVTGFDGTELATHADPPLTTMEAPLYEIGERGVQMLLQQMNEEISSDAPLEVLLPARLLVHASTSAPEVSGHAVATSP